VLGCLTNDIYLFPNSHIAGVRVLSFVFETLKFRWAGIICRKLHAVPVIVRTEMAHKPKSLVIFGLCLLYYNVKSGLSNGKKRRARLLSR
jgi:hypothetical protein